MVPMTLIWWIYHFWARFWPYFNFVDFRAYFGPFSHVNRVEHKNLSLNFNLLSITLKFFLWPHTTQGHEWLIGCSSIQKRCNVKHPNDDKWILLSPDFCQYKNLFLPVCNFIFETRCRDSLNINIKEELIRISSYLVKETWHETGAGIWKVMLSMSVRMFFLQERL